MFQVIGDKFYATAQAYIVEGPEDLVDREMASEFKMDRENRSFVWVAGRYVQANNPNKNGHFWTFDDLKKGEASIKHTPVNALHEWNKPIGTVVQTKIVDRQAASNAETYPEIQALSVVWGANFPEAAVEIKKAHKENSLFYSMECVAEATQCLTCERTFAFFAQGSEVCEHLATNPNQPRRFINPTFLGAALIFPPERPAWPDAEISEVASLLTQEYAARNSEAAKWEGLMSHVLANI